jgi:purine-binding chemotaxis protein CheW
MNRELSELQLTCFNLGDNLFAVDIMRIKEIVLPQKLFNLPRASQLLEGVINLRGAVIPVMDLRKRFGMPPLANGKSGKLLIVSLLHQMVALEVDDVMEVITVPAREIKPPPDVAEGVGAEYLLGVCLSSDRVFMLLDIDSLLGPADYREIARIA